ncbi:unnamed protein product [Parajaminaea phylloscopi]
MASFFKKLVGSVSGTSTTLPPLAGLKVVEFAGLAPGPMVGLVLADFGADVIRIDRVGATLNADGLCRGKRSVCIDPKNPEGLQTLKRLIGKADVLIDPFRPGVLERLGLGPEQFHTAAGGPHVNEGLVFARITGFQRQGPYANMAGHDINYIALSGLLSMLGAAGGPPQPPVNLLGDFAGGSFVCLLGILMALLERARSGKGQVVEADMVTGARYLATFLLLTSHLEHPETGAVVGDGSDERRGTGMLGGGAPWYGVYRCKDGGWMSVGAIEPQFYRQLLSLLKANVAPSSSLSHPDPAQQNDHSQWPAQRDYFTQVFALKTRAEWGKVFLGTDACCVPILSRDEAAVQGLTPAVSHARVFEDMETVVPSPAPHLTRTPAKVAPGSPQAAEDEVHEMLLSPGEHSLGVLRDWLSMDDEEATRLSRAKAIGGDDLDDLKAKL